MFCYHRSHSLYASDGKETIYCGNEKLLKEHHFAFTPVQEAGTVIYVAKDNEYLGAIIIKDEVKEESINTISYLTTQNIKTIMLTGDNEQVAQEVSNQLNMTSYKASLLPQDKVNEVDYLINNKNSMDSSVVKKIKFLTTVLLS